MLFRAVLDERDALLDWLDDGGDAARCVLCGERGACACPVAPTYDAARRAHEFARAQRVRVGAALEQQAVDAEVRATERQLRDVARRVDRAGH